MKAITEEIVKSYREKYVSDNKKIEMTKILATESIYDVTLNSQKAAENTFKFSIDLPTMDAVSQGNSGRCWIVAGLNLLRELASREPDRGNDTIDFSQAYVAFWDKVEKANCFLEMAIHNANCAYDDKKVRGWFRYAITDGGFWTYFTDLINKYGLVPNEVMPETAQSLDTEEMNCRLNEYIRKIGADIRNAYSGGAKIEELYEIKEYALENIISFLCECYSCPPEKFQYTYTNKQGKVQSRDYTPHSFKDKMIGDILGKMSAVISLPFDHLPFGLRCKLSDTYKVIGGRDEIFWNLSMEKMKRLCVEQLTQGIPVVCVADDDKRCVEELQLWDDQCFDYKKTIGFSDEMNRKDYFQLKAGTACHSMLITGVNLDENGMPNRWKIENSYGIEGLHKGYYTCSDTWFQKYMVSVVILNQYLEDERKEQDGQVNEFYVDDII